MPAWWAEYGRPGWVADTWLGAAAPWVLAGHGRGGWTLDEPSRAPQGLPYPGVGAIHSAAVWYDSVTVRAGEGSVWQGFRGSLARVEGSTGGSGERRAVGVVDLRGGDFGFDDNALMIDRRDSLSWLRGEAYSSERGYAGALDLAGRHLWGLAGGVRRGHHALEATFAQRGVGARLVGSEEEGAGGASGSAAYRYRGPELGGIVRLARGYDHRESFSDFEPYSRRDASEFVAEAEVEHARGLGGRVEFRRARVWRTESGAFATRARSAWAAARLARPLGDGMMTVEIGAGRHGALGGLDWAPGVSYHVSSQGFEAKVSAERILHAVWSDLAEDERAFMQRTWVATIDLRLRRPAGRRAGVQFMAGRTELRALMSRIPITDFALRRGFTPQRDPYSFGLLTVEARETIGPLGLVGEGFALARPRDSDQTQVDPGWGLRAYAERSFTAFSGDLGVTLRAGCEGVGARESEATPGWMLPGYVTSTAVGIFTLADAMVTVRLRNLENRVQAQPWTDSYSEEEAVGTGRELRFALTLILKN